MRFIIGQMARLSGEFQDGDSRDDVDPTNVYLRIRKPDATETTYTYGIGIVVVRDSIGNFHADIALDQVGLWFYRWVSTGAVTAADERGFQVDESEFTSP